MTSKILSILLTITLALTFTACGEDDTVTTTSSTNIAIPDNDTVGITSTLAYSDAVLSTSKVTVTLNITHTWVGDLQVMLMDPTGTKLAMLTMNNGGTGDNYTNTVFDDAAGTAISVGVAPFTGTFTPTSPLSTFNGLDPYGVWTLWVVDSSAGDTGTLNSWSMTVE